MTRSFHAHSAIQKNASKQEKFYVARALAAQIHPGHKRMVYSHKHTLTQELVFFDQSVCECEWKSSFSLILQRGF
jgi:hypothetical protein